MKAIPYNKLGLGRIITNMSDITDVENLVPGAESK
jgi:hypothetical protein